MAAPLVSICIPVRNGENHLKDALDSALSQSYPNIEVIVVDNASTDRTADILSDYALRKTPRLKLFRNNTMLPMTENFNCAAKQAMGEYLKILPHDDLLTTDSVLTLMQAAREGDALIVGLRDFIFENVSSREKTMYRNLNRFWRADRFLGTDGVSAEHYLRRIARNTTHNVVGEPGNVLIRRDVYHEAGGFQSDFHQLCDVRLWHAIAMRYGLRVVPAKVAMLRVHSASQSSGRSDPQVGLRLLREHQMLSAFVHSYCTGDCPADVKNQVLINLSLDTARLLAVAPHEVAAQGALPVHYQSARRITKWLPLKRVYQLMATRVLANLKSIW